MLPTSALGDPASVRITDRTSGAKSRLLLKWDPLILETCTLVSKALQLPNLHIVPWLPLSEPMPYVLQIHVSFFSHRKKERDILFSLNLEESVITKEAAFDIEKSIPTQRF